ncbi:dyslexia-associated protein KIAA0319 homolog [Aphidius gifuensis]|uniref:dyslexia-associated protein KIAA0319 homolog n=1 Tax=Aphidius gifuensis TaxID=684658 RepID=UPI001CDBF68E|nr:dyslexia-associated protein KIAA0319 homolog [Aphidius gifuensis]XP_044017264.1 dyslexia-associated protein KIAA0319 homolog [Aphidius gifuensis]XP_044017265.1 dyslexia-associated protein KIAA0319 homolog [Aphidius gifuensis]
MLNIIYLLLILALGALTLGKSLDDWQTSNYDRIKKWQIQNSCLKLYPKVFTSFTPRGNLSNNVISKQQLIFDMENCVKTCCVDDECNVAFMYNKTCYHVKCKYSSEMCIPLYRPDLSGLIDPPRMVLVRPMENDRSWSDWLTYSTDDGMIPKDGCVNDDDCQNDEICLPKDTPNDLQKLNDKGQCQSIQFPSNKKSTELSLINYENNDKSSTSKQLKQLTVSVLSKEVRLPESDVTLSAYIMPAETPTETYNYVWSLLSQPGNTGTMTGQNSPTVKLSNLSEGLYRFRIAVTSQDGYGENYANVSVLPANRINQPPIAIILPASQIVKLPNTEAVLDGSLSKDDDHVISYHWELTRGPIGYQAILDDTPTIQLKNLIAGNYTFKLTVEDSNKATNWTTANITVLKVPDYPPNANAGQDIIIYLPNNKIILNGNLSSDDRGISSWEWTKSPSDQNKAVDMQNTRTPYLKLSNLEEGIYTFVLKVEDDSQQSSTAEVHVFVKPPTNKPPKADAGGNLTLALPTTTARLDGSNSKDNIKTYNWYQINGPSDIKFTNNNDSITNITNLTKGLYKIKLTVVDINGNADSDIIFIKVTQNKNQPPIANAGGDQIIYAPVFALIVNGSKSSDDLLIKEWIWTRDPESLAIGTIIPKTNESSVLIVTGDIVPGRYVFRLKVSDEQGDSSEDTASIIVKSDPELFHLAELTLNIGANLLTKTQQDSIILKLQMLLHEVQNIKIILRDLKVEPRTGKAKLIFFVQQENNGIIKSLSGIEVVQRLKDKLLQDSELLQLSVASIDTAICQNNCSGHGVCNEETRQCLCEAFWMQNLIEQYLGNGEV